MQLLLISFGIVLVSSIIAIIVGIVQLIATKGEIGLKHILGGVLGIVIGLLIGFGTCVLSFNGNSK